MEAFDIQRDGKTDLKFTGEQVASASSKAVYNDGGRWTVLKLYKTKGGKYVCQSIGRTCWEGETDRYSGEVCNTEAEVIAFFGHGRLAKELYHEAGLSDAETVE